MAASGAATGPVGAARERQYGRLAQRAPVAAIAAFDADAGDVAGGTLAQVELGAVADLLLVGEGDPREVAEVTALAGGDEADRDGVGPLVALALVAVALLVGLEGVGGAGEAAAAPADEPAREFERAHSDLRRRLAGVAGGGEAEVTLGGEVEVGVERLEARDQRAAQPGLVEALVAVAAVAPVLEAADDHGPVDEVDHGPRPVHADHLALADLAVRALGDVALRFAAGHQRLSSSWAKRSQRCVLGSTSRIEVGATKRRSSWSCGGSSVAKYMTGLPSCLARSRSLQIRWAALPSASVPAARAITRSQASRKLRPAGLDGLAEADVVGDKEVGARQLERLHQRRELVSHELDAGAQRGLKPVGVGRADGAPLEGVEVGAEVGRRIETRGLAEPVGLGLDDASADLEVPEELEGAARGVVIEAGEAQERRLAVLARRDALDEPLAAAGGEDLALARDAVMGEGRGDGLEGGIEAGGGGELGDQVLAGGEAIRKAMGAAHSPELVAPELAEDVEDLPVAEDGSEELGDLGPGLPRGAKTCAEDPAEIEEPFAVERAEDSRSAGAESWKDWEAARASPV